MLVSINVAIINSKLHRLSILNVFFLVLKLDDLFRYDIYYFRYFVLKNVLLVKQLVNCVRIISRNNMSIIVVLHLKVSIYSKQRRTLLRLAKIVTNGMLYVISCPPLGYVYIVCIT